MFLEINRDWRLFLFSWHCGHVPNRACSQQLMSWPNPFPVCREWSRRVSLGFLSNILGKKELVASCLGHFCCRRDLSCQCGFIWSISSFAEIHGVLKNNYFIWLHRVLFASRGIFSFRMRILNWGMWDLVPWPVLGSNPGPLLWEIRVLSHWAIREVPIQTICKFKTLFSTFWTERVLVLSDGFRH